MLPGGDKGPTGFPAQVSERLRPGLRTLKDGSAVRPHSSPIGSASSIERRGAEITHRKPDPEDAMTQFNAHSKFGRSICAAAAVLSTVLMLFSIANLADHYRNRAQLAAIGPLADRA